MYCIYCGTKIEQKDVCICPNCGKAIYQDAKPTVNATNTNISQKTSNNRNLVGLLSTIIGAIFGLLSICTIATNGRFVGYDSWSFTYGGGMSLFIVIGLISIISIIVGIILLLNSSNSTKK